MFYILYSYRVLKETHTTYLHAKFGTWLGIANVFIACLPFNPTIIRKWEKAYSISMNDFSEISNWPLK